MKRQRMVADTGEDTRTLGASAGDETMPAGIRRLQLPSVRAALKGLLPVEGFNTLEIYAGECTLTIALVWCMLPCFAPWDIVWGTMRCHQPRVDDTGTNTGRQVTILSLRQPVSVVDSSAESAIEEP